MDNIVSLLSKLSRRGFLKYGSLSGLAAFITSCLSQNAPAASPAPATGAISAAPTVVTRAETINLKGQSSFAARDFLHEMAVDYTKKVDDMSGGRLKIQLQASGAIVGAFDVVDAVHSGTLDVGIGVPAYWFGKKWALTLFGTGPNFGMDANMMLGWMYYGGGAELWTEFIQQKLRLNVQSFFFGPMPTQPLGWFRNEITGPNDFRGLKFRTVGAAIDVFTDLGASVIAVPGGEVVPSLERGVIDAGEFNNTTSDRAFGFQDVRKVLMAKSYHQPTEFWEVQINKGKWDSLSATDKNILKWAAFAQHADTYWKFMDRNSKDLDELKKANVKVFQTPKSILEAQLRAWDTIIAKESAKDPDVKRVVDSQRAWAQRVMTWYREIDLDRPDPVSFQHYFGTR